MSIVSALKGRLGFAGSDTPTVVRHRTEGQDVALVLLHGFSGDTRATWAPFVDLLLKEQSFSTWDLFGLGYPTSLRIDVPQVWAADPDLAVLSRELRTTLSIPPLATYRRVAIAAHSMGGLILQRALLDDGKLQARTSHAFLFGTPSNGLTKAGPLQWFKRQFRDMAAGSAFITSLRADWSAAFGKGTPFAFRVIAGDRDEFVPSSSSLTGFAESDLAVVPGNHLEIVKPPSASHQSALLMMDSLSGSRRALPPVDGARLAVERGRYQEAIATLLPRAADLDSAALGSLALALEAEGRSREALEVLEQRSRSGGGVGSTDAMGILAGRLKRRWLTERIASDFQRARALYSEALQLSEADGDHAQAYYHAINVAFLDLAALPEASDVPEGVRSCARRALEHCAGADASHWRDATEGEARLMLGDLVQAEQKYRQAVAQADSTRDIDSMYVQAVRVAGRVFGEDGVTRIEEIFGVGRGPG
jgi:hypothetical protein